MSEPPTPHTIELRFNAWAQAEDALRAALIVGSQARLDHPADAWSDLDLILSLADDQVETYLGRTDWLEQFAPVWLSHLGRTVAGEPERLVLYEGGLQVDFVFHPVSELARAKEMLLSGALPDTLLRGVRVLVDKDGMIPDLPPPARPRPATPPSGEAFRQALDNFWFSAVYCAKQLRRGELWMFQNGSMGMQWSLLGMLEWQAHAEHGWDHDTWHAGKFIAEWAGPDEYAALREVFAHFDLEDGWRAMHARLALFHRLARDTAARLGFPYPTEMEEKISACVEAIRSA